MRLRVSQSGKASNPKSLGAEARYWISRLLLSLASLVVGLAVAELLATITNLDGHLLVGALFFQAADIAVHRISEDPFLHYELNPGAHYRGAAPGKPPYEVTIDEHGARFPMHSATKAPGTFRILAFGGSTLYGGAVSDSETIAAALERRLNDDAASGTGSRHFEVWNFGTSAYTLGQAAHLARQKVGPLRADLILVQHHNRGRRPFLMPEDRHPERYLSVFLRSDPYLYEEQFSAPSIVPQAMHQRLMRYSAIYRSVIALLPALRATYGDEYCERLSAEEARALSREAEAHQVPVVYFAIPADRQQLGPATIFPELSDERFIDLYLPDRDPVFYEVHPPGFILDEFAGLLIGQLKARALLPVAQALSESKD